MAAGSVTHRQRMCSLEETLDRKDEPMRKQVNAVICAGTLSGGEIEPGTMHGGEIEPGTMHGGEIEPGTMHGYEETGYGVTS